MSNPAAVVLAAGEGTRLRPLTRYRPKPMLPAGNRPILEFVLDELIACGIRDVTLVVGYRRNRIQSHFGPTYRELELSYTIQNKQLGTGHALLETDLPAEEPVVVVYGDQIVDCDVIADVLCTHDGGLATLGVLRNRDVTHHGGVILANDHVEEIVERPRDDRDYLLNAGVYVFEPSFREVIRTAPVIAGERSLIDAITVAIEEGDGVSAAVAEGFWTDATYPWDLREIAAELLATGRLETAIPASASVHDTAVIRDQVAIGPDCEIGPGAVVGPTVSLGQNVTVEANAVVAGSVIDADNRIGANATVIDAVTGVGTTIGPGSIIPGGPGDVRIDDQVFTDAPLGALVADRVTDDGGVGYEPGTIVGPDASLEFGGIVRGRIPEGTRVSR